jgi:hypothetical protein
MRTFNFVAFVAVLGCTQSLAQNSPDVSPTTYQNFTCLQLAHEGRSISKKGFALSGLESGKGGSDATETTSAVVIVWPTSRSVGDKQRLANLAHADSEMNALEQASIESQCSIRFQRPPKG